MPTVTVEANGARAGVPQARRPGREPGPAQGSRSC